MPHFSNADRRLNKDFQIVYDDFGNIFYSYSEYVNARYPPLTDIQRRIYETTNVWKHPRRDINRQKPKRPKGYWKKLATSVFNEILPSDYKVREEFINREFYLLWLADNRLGYGDFYAAVASWALGYKVKRQYKVMKRLGTFP